MPQKLIKIDECKHKKTIICVDLNNVESILSYVFQDGVDKEFKEIRGLLKNSLRNREKYCKANISDKAKDVFEMRFTRQRNDRIYCKEFHRSKKKNHRYD